MTDTATHATLIEQQSPLLRLPSEIRLMIYAFALENTIDAVRAVSFLKDMSTTPCPPIHGALALLHTNSLIRSKSSDAMEFLAKAHFDHLDREQTRVIRLDYLIALRSYPRESMR